MNTIKSLSDLRPGDIMFGPIGGATGLLVGAGQLALGEGFRVGRLSIRHVGIVVESARPDAPGSDVPGGLVTEDGPMTFPRLAQAMPGGAEIVDMRQQTHWTERHAYVRLPEDYPGQAEDAAAVARLMVEQGVAYSFASYAALGLHRFGVDTPRLTKWIGRRRPATGRIELPSGRFGAPVGLPVEAICSVFADQAWSLTGKRVIYGTQPQVVTPGMLVGQLWTRSLMPESRLVWGGPAVQT